MARKSRKNPVLEVPAPSIRIRTALYVRLSVEADRRHETSIETQILILNNYIEDKPEFQVCKTYIDNGMSGTNFRRPGFQQMLMDIEDGLIDCVMVKDLSRLGRNAIDTGYYIEQYFRMYNVRFIAVTDQFDTADPNNLHGGIMLPLKNMINEAYALDIGRKIKAQAHQAMKDGDFIGARAPYGYRKDPDNCHKLVVDEATAPVVRQIFAWAFAHVSLNEIGVRLNAANILSPSHYKVSTGEITSPELTGDGTWQNWTVDRILRNEVYVGDMVQGKTVTMNHCQKPVDKENYIVVRNTHEAIIPREVFEAVQEYRDTVAEKARAAQKEPFTPNLFKGKVFCAHCGKNLHRQRNKRKHGPDAYVFYCISNSRIGKGTCLGVMLTEKALIDTVTSILEKELSVSLGMSVPLFQLEARQKRERDALNTEISVKSQQIDKYRRMTRGLYENLMQENLTTEEYFAFKQDYEGKVSTLQAEISELERQISALAEEYKRYRAMEQDATRLAQDHTLTAELIERLIQRIEVTHEKKIRVYFCFKSEYAESEV